MKLYKCININRNSASEKKYIRKQKQKLYEIFFINRFLIVEEIQHVEIIQFYRIKNPLREELRMCSVLWDCSA